MKKTQEMLEGTHKRNGLAWRGVSQEYAIKTDLIWKVEGESSNGGYLDGDEFPTEEEANYARRMLEMEFPENVYWVDSYERMQDWESWK